MPSAFFCGTRSRSGLVQPSFHLPPSQYVLSNASKQELRMEAQAEFGSERFEMRVRYIVTVECADDLINDEIIMMVFP